MNKLDGKVAIVTDASKGIGAAIAKGLGAEGAAVAVNYSLDKEGAARTVSEIMSAGGKAIVIQGRRAKQHAGHLRRSGLVPWIVCVATVTATGFGLFHKAAAFSEFNGAADGAPVVLELFTSEGCSSCPLPSELGSSSKSVLPLAYTVDYWNHLGWSDLCVANY